MAIAFEQIIVVKLAVFPSKYFMRTKHCRLFSNFFFSSCYMVKWYMYVFIMASVVFDRPETMEGNEKKYIFTYMPSNLQLQWINIQCKPTHIRQPFFFHYEKEKSFKNPDDYTCGMKIDTLLRTYTHAHSQIYSHIA